MKYLLGLIALITCLSFFGCKSNATSDDPTKVLKSFFEHLSKNDIDGATQYVTADSKSTMQMMKKGLSMAEKAKDSLTKNNPLKEFQNIEFGTPRIEGDFAFVSVSSKTHQSPSAEFKLVKEGVGWKVDFTMATLMKMGSNAISENAPDSFGLNKEITNTADSIIKQMDPETINQLQKELDKLK